MLATISVGKQIIYGNNYSMGDFRLGLKLEEELMQKAYHNGYQTGRGLEQLSRDDHDEYVNDKYES